MPKYIFDIETDGLKPTVIHCIAVVNTETEEQLVFRSDQHDIAKEFNGLLSGDKCTLIGHNIIGYDIPACEKILGTDFSKHEIIDTLVLSRLANPSQLGGHSLENWGEILGYPKGCHTDWSMVTDDMVEYCLRDTLVNLHVYRRLLESLKGFTPESIALEHSVQRIIRSQIQTGWLLDQQKCLGLLAELNDKLVAHEETVRRTFVPKATLVKEITPKYTKDGKLSKVGLQFLKEDWETVGGPFSRIEWPEFNLGSRRQIGKYLMDAGWKPVDFTETGQPKVDESTLKDVKGIPEAALIAEYLMLQKRIAQVQSWVSAVDDDDDRVHGYVNSNGAVTGRMTHSSPNMAQVPACGAPYGEECRSCWVVPEGYKLVGADASGLELRMLAHYMNDDEYTKEILHGDIHTANQRSAGLAERNQAKTFIYAFLYGAGDAKIGSIVGGSSRTGRKLKDRFLKNTPSLGRLRDNVENAAERGYLVGLDGRRVAVRSPHAALNTLLQSAGAIIMKKALCIFDEYATLWGLDFKYLGNIHDEIQVEVLEKDADKVGYLLVESIKAAGAHFNLRCPLDGEYKIGTNWSETH